MSPKLSWRGVRRWAKRVGLSVGIVVVLTLIVGFSCRSTRWRLQLMGRKLQGNVPELSWGELLHMIAPRSKYQLYPVIAEGRSIFAAIKNPYATPRDREEGSKLFRARCSVCHGQDAIGDKGPSLIRSAYSHGNADWAIYRVIERGVPKTAMPASHLGEVQIWQVIAYLRGRQSEAAVGELATVHPKINVTHEALLAAPDHPDEWLTHSRTFDGSRYSPLAEITTANVRNLKLRWVRQLATTDNVVEATPLVSNGVMFVSEPPASVVALDAKTGAELWHYTHDLPSDISLCCGRVNRGVALLGGLVYLGTLDAKLIALDAADGSVKWETKVADVSDGYSITVAPLAVGDLVITGVSGGEFGIRGFLAAYAADTGKEVWRFNTVPKPGEPGHETWAGDSWKSGGGPTWVTGAYDPVLDLVYWGVGNPGPVYSGEDRAGDNLYTNSVIAIARKTGKLAWHFQFTPHDDHDWDSNQTPILADLTIAGQPRKVICWANRNGFYYVLDRVTGEFLSGTPFVKQTWATGLDPKGRPIEAPGSHPTRDGALVFPGVAGGTNWQSAAFHPGLGSIFIPATEGSSVFTSSEPEPHMPGALFVASGSSNGHFEPVVKALDATTGEKRWEYKPPRAQAVGGRSGLLTTAGDLVFGAVEGQLFGLDAKTGRELWRVGLGGLTAAAPVSFTVDGHQMIAVAGGRSVFLFGM